MTGLPTWAYELVAAPAAVGLAFLHSRRALGAGRAAVELLALALYGYAVERVAIAVFASHAYGAGWRLAPGGVPVAVAACWAAVIVSALATAARLGVSSRLGRAGAAAVLGLTLDVMMEPVAVRAGLWSWTPAGPWLGVPIGNFVGWAVIVGTYAWGAQGGNGEAKAALAARRALLGAACIAGLLVVGAAWTRLSAERAFASGRGWMVWAAVVILAAGVALRPRAPHGAGPGGPAGAGAAPAAALLVVAAPFAADALLSGETALAAAASGPLLVLVGTAVSARTRPSLPAHAGDSLRIGPSEIQREGSRTTR